MIYKILNRSLHYNTGL